MVRRVGVAFGGDHVGPAENINSLDEVPNSTWFTNRIGLYQMTPNEVALANGNGVGPQPNKPWTIIRGKLGGVSPGFQIRDTKGDRYIIKFDAAGYPCMMTAPGVITGRILYAAGYNVPEDYPVSFRRDDIRIADDAIIERVDGSKSSYTDSDLEAVLGFVQRMPDGSWRALASKLLEGELLGPFDYQGRRHDDANDNVKHENRRELRGLRMFAAWLKHHDTKQGNSLDVFLGENGRGFVKHYLIDFASTLGTGARGPHAKQGFEYGFDILPVTTRAVTLGFYESKWRRLRRPEGLHECGYFEDKLFDPYEFKSLSPNAAFANMTDRDAYWAAKIIVSFRDDHLRAVVKTGEYLDEGATEYIGSMLASRRDIIARAVFDRVPPLDFFSVTGDVASFHDLGVEYDTYPQGETQYRYRCAPVEANRSGPGWSEWTESAETSIDLASGPAAAVFQSASATRFPFYAIECQLDRGDGWSSSVLVYASRHSGRVVELRR
jgi:hypothetical protein